MITGRATASTALAAFSEGRVAGAKVVVFGSALSPLADRLVERGARLVYVYDANPGRVAEANARGGSRNVSYAPLAQAGSPVRDGAFDFGIVEDATRTGLAPSELMSVVAKALSPQAVALVACPNPEATSHLIEAPEPAAGKLGYYELYDAVSPHFDEVRMLGQTPFVGYAIADFGTDDEDVDVRLDTSLVAGGAEEPEWFIALASHTSQGAESFSVIQLPLADVGPLVGSRPSGDATPERVLELQRELDKREEWLLGLESRAATADERADGMQSDLDRLTEDARQAELALEEARRELVAVQRSKRNLEAERETGQVELDALAQRCEELEQINQKLGRENKRLTEALGQSQARQSGQASKSADASKLELEKLRASLEEEKQACQRAQRAASEASAQSSQLRQSLEAEKKLAEGAQRESVKQRRETEALAKKLSEGRQREEALEQKVEAAVAKQKGEHEKAEQLRLALEQLEQRAESQQSDALAAAKQELAELEERLRERGRAVLQLEEELEAARRLGKELLLQLETAQEVGSKAGADAGEGSEPSESTLQRDVARLSADLEAARWTIEALEGRLGGAPQN